MELNEFPRPKDDTGIGLHWSPGAPAAVGTRRLKEQWIPLLRSMGVRWVRFSHIGGEGLAELLLAEGIMPIVCLQSFAPYPCRAGAALEESVRRYAALGVRYFELGPGLDDPRSWQDGRLPAEGVAPAVPALLEDIRMVREAGALPGLPAVDSAGSAWDLLGAICQAGEADLLRDGVWLAHHIVVGNLPLDYPDDAVNQLGTPLSPHEYDEALREEWAGHAWGGLSRDEVNRERARRRSPDSTIATAKIGWQRYALLEARARRHLGYALPILGTSGGPRVGDFTDPRYPAVSPARHAESALGIFRAMMGTSAEYPLAPGCLFCAALSVAGNYALGHFEPSWERWAWVGPRWEQGRLPAVDRLRSEPKRARLEEAWAERAGAAVRDAEPSPVPARDQETVDDFVEPALGRPLYALLSPEEWREEDDRGIPSTFAPEPFSFWPPATLTGRLKGGAGQHIMLISQKDGKPVTQVVGEDESFVFRGVRPGVYALTVEGASMTLAEISLDSGDEPFMELTMPGWSWKIEEEQAPLGFGIVRFSIEDMPGVQVRLWSEEWPGIEREVREWDADGRLGCEFAPLAEGRYYLQAGDIMPALELDVHRDGILHVMVTRLQPAEAVQEAGPEPATTPAPKEPGEIDLYLLLARPLASKEELSAVLQFMKAHRPVCGFRAEEAAWAKRVLIIGGGTLRVSGEDEARLREQGCRVYRIETKVAETLTKLARAGEAFDEDERGD